MGDMLNTRPGAPNDPTTGQASSGAGELLPPIKPPLALVGERLKRGLPLPPEYQAARASHFWPLLPHPAWHPFQIRRNREYTANRPADRTAHQLAAPEAHRQADAASNPLDRCAPLIARRAALVARSSGLRRQRAQ